MEGEHWLVEASFVVLETGIAPFSTLPQGTEPGAGLASVSSGAELNENFASRRNGAERESTPPSASTGDEPAGASEADLLTLLALDLFTENRRRR